jgi:hypothetical protein
MPKCGSEHVRVLISVFRSLSSNGPDRDSVSRTGPETECRSAAGLDRGIDHQQSLVRRASVCVMSGGQPGPSARSSRPEIPVSYSTLALSLSLSAHRAVSPADSAMSPCPLLAQFPMPEKCSPAAVRPDPDPPRQGTCPCI